MERPNNPFRAGGIAYEVMEMALQGEFDGLPGTDDLTVDEIAEILCVDRTAIANSIVRIKKKTGYVIPYIKMICGRRRLEW